jgi:hypothetical protein
MKTMLKSLSSLLLVQHSFCSLAIGLGVHVQLGAVITPVFRKSKVIHQSIES